MMEYGNASSQDSSQERKVEEASEKATEAKKKWSMKNKKYLSDRDAYNDWKKKNGNNLSYNKYCLILSLYVKYMIDFAIEGFVTDMYGGLGLFYIKKVMRGSKNMSIDWKNSIKNEAGKIVTKVFHNSPWYVKYHWGRNRVLVGCKLKVTRGSDESPTNNIKKLKDALRLNSMLHVRYAMSQKVVRIISTDKEGKVEIYSSYSMLPKGWDTNVKNVADTEHTAYGMSWRIEYGPEETTHNPNKTNEDY